MATDTRDTRAIAQIACPFCLAPKGEPCRGRVFAKWSVENQFTVRPQCHTARRKANQEQHRTGDGR